MDEVLREYKRRKFQKCFEFMKSVKESDDVVENFILENCKLVCKSLIRMEENDPDKIYDMQEQYYAFFEKVITSDTALANSIPLELKLTVTFNLFFWLLFYNDIEIGISEIEGYLEVVNKALEAVLGKTAHSVTASMTSEKILSNLMRLKGLLPDKEHKIMFLILELVVVTVMYIINLKRTSVRECLKIIALFIKESKTLVNLVAVNDFLQVTTVSPYLFKFGLSGGGTLVSELNGKVVDCLHLLESTFLFLMEDFKGSLKSLQKNTDTSFKSLWSYLVVLNSFELENWNLCSGFLAKMSSNVVQKNLRARFHIMQGRLCSIERKHKDALREYETALSLSPNFPAAYYYIGKESGKMGLADSMVENFEKLVRALQLGDHEDDFKPNFETTLLDWIHPANEIMEGEAYYALAISYGLNESFKKSAEIFEKVLQFSHDFLKERKKRIVEFPNFLTILHDASVMNLLYGNLVRAEQIILDAIDRYVPKEPEIRSQRANLYCKDSEWLRRIVEQELLETNLEPKKLSTGRSYTEDLIFFFSQNALGLLILSEIQRIQEIEDYKTTISNVFSMFFKYIASMHKKEKLTEEEELVLTLVKGLTGKTCVRIALIQMKENDKSDVEKMFKRALNCNKGDKDALYEYYKFLLKAGESREALKLWNTFSKEKIGIEIDSLQSFSLRYFLNDKITKRELENIQREIDSSEMISFQL